MEPEPGDTESPEYGDLFVVWGEKGPRGKPYGKRNELVCCSRAIGARRGSSHDSLRRPVARLMRVNVMVMREMCWDVALTRLPLCSLMNRQLPTYATKFTGGYPVRHEPSGGPAERDDREGLRQRPRADEFRADFHRGSRSHLLKGPELCESKDFAMPEDPEVSAYLPRSPFRLS